MKEAELYDRSAFLKIAVKKWKELQKNKPELAKDIMADPEMYDYKKVRSSNGEIYCVPIMFSEEEIERQSNELKKFDDMPTIDEYVAKARRNGDTRSDDELVKDYAEEYYN